MRSYHCGLVKVRVRPLTWARALPGISVTTSALACSDNDRTGCGQYLMVPQEQEPAGIARLAEIDDHDAVLRGLDPHLDIAAQQHGFLLGQVADENGVLYPLAVTFHARRDAPQPATLADVISDQVAASGHRGLPGDQRLILRQLADQVRRQDPRLQLDGPPVTYRVAEHRMPQLSRHPPLPRADHRLAPARRQCDTAGPHHEVSSADLPIVDQREHGR